VTVEVNDAAPTIAERAPMTLPPAARAEVVLRDTDEPTDADAARELVELKVAAPLTPGPATCRAAVAVRDAAAAYATLAAVERVSVVLNTALPVTLLSAVLRLAIATARP
jgi:hypothetical protein